MPFPLPLPLFFLPPNPIPIPFAISPARLMRSTATTSNTTTSTYRPFLAAPQPPAPSLPPQQSVSTQPTAPKRAQASVLFRRRWRCPHPRLRHFCRRCRSRRRRVRSRRRRARLVVGRRRRMGRHPRHRSSPVRRERWVRERGIMRLLEALWGLWASLGCRYDEGVRTGVVMR